jgi:hypothetical protein
MKTSMAKFPFQKTLQRFDFKFQPSIDVKVIKELATGRFIANADNALLFGPPGVGKTHLAVGIGMKAGALGHRTVFTTAAGELLPIVKTRNRPHQRADLPSNRAVLTEPATVREGNPLGHCRERPPLSSKANRCRSLYESLGPSTVGTVSEALFCSHPLVERHHRVPHKNPPEARYQLWSSRPGKLPYNSV